MHHHHDRDDATRVRSVPSVDPRLIGAGLAVIGLAAASAIYNNRRARQAEADNPPAGRFVEVDGVRLHYVEEGTGPAVLLIHGNALTWEDWRLSGVFDRLAETHRVIAFDRVGFGYSARPHDRIWTVEAQAKILLEAARALGAERPVVVGHSFGAEIALAMGVVEPDALAGLVLVSGYYFASARLDAIMSVPGGMPGVGHLFQNTVTPFISRATMGKFVRKMFAPLPVPPRFAAWPGDMTARPSQLRASAADGALMLHGVLGLAGRLERMQVPTRIFAGAEDKVVDTDAQARKLERTLPQAQLRIVPGAGHMAHYADPEGVARAASELAARA